MIATFIFVALVAASQAQAELHSAPIQSVAVQSNPADMQLLWCVAKNWPQLNEVYNDAAQHTSQMLSASVQFAKLLAPCLRAEDRSACAAKAWHNFLESDLDATVRGVVNKLQVFHQSVHKCLRG